MQKMRDRFFRARPDVTKRLDRAGIRKSGRRRAGDPYELSCRWRSVENSFTSCLGRGKKGGDDGKEFTQEPFGYHPKMGGYPDLFNHLFASITFEQAHRLIKRGQITALDKAIPSRIDANASNRFGWTLLMLAVDHHEHTNLKQKRDRIPLFEQVAVPPASGCLDIGCAEPLLCPRHSLHRSLSFAVLRLRKR